MSMQQNCELCLIKLPYSNFIKLKLFIITYIVRISTKLVNHFEYQIFVCQFINLVFDCFIVTFAVLVTPPHFGERCYIISHSTVSSKVLIV